MRDGSLPKALVSLFESANCRLGSSLLAFNKAPSSARKTLPPPPLRFNSSNARLSEPFPSKLTKHLSIESLEPRDLTQFQQRSRLSAFYLATRATTTTMTKPNHNYVNDGGAPSTPSKAPYKRKRKAGEERFYAVRAGRIPGVYATWAECQSMITGFQGAVYKAFPTHDEASLFAAGKNPNPGSTPSRFYAVAVGNSPGIYTEWADAQAAYTGVKAPKYKKFETREAAEEWMEGFDGGLAGISHGGLKLEEDDDDDEDEDEEDAPPSNKKIKTEFKSEIEVNIGDQYGSLEEVYTDGSTLNNGQEGAVAGVGVFFSESDSRNISERLPGEVQTNQRAELTAILRALQTIPPTHGVLIWSDSMYAIKCVTEWFVKWETNGWKTHKGPVQNRDLVEMVLKEIRKREALGTKTVIKWVKGHESNVGNVAADGLAVRGANEAKASGEVSGKKRRK